MIWRSGTLRAGAAFALATYPAGQHLKFRIVARLPAARTVVRVRAAAIRMQRLQQEAALVGVARDDQPGDRRERTPGFLIAPRLAVLRHGCEPDQPTRVAVAALDVALARVGEHRLHAGTKEFEVEWRIRLG